MSHAPRKKQVFPQVGHFNDAPLRHQRNRRREKKPWVIEWRCVFAKGWRACRRYRKKLDRDKAYADLKRKEGRLFSYRLPENDPS